MRHYEIRAAYDRETITIYQAYSAAIAQPALKAQTFVPPFSFQRMTWIKPSFLWLMERSNWGQKPQQEMILAVRIKRSGWEQALLSGVLTSYEPKVHRSLEDWQKQFASAVVHVQWDPERSLRGADVGYDSIQVGLSRHVIQDYVQNWIVGIEDYTPLVRKLHDLIRRGHSDKAAKLLPKEKPYPVSADVARKLMITSTSS
jgi:hypothetical protein